MKAVGLYDPAFEHDACGVAFVARLDGSASHETLERALAALANLEHRGAQGADADSGDGAGMLLRLPDALFRDELGAALPEPGAYGVAVAFLPYEDDRFERLLEDVVEAEGQRVLGWRDVPVDPRHVGGAAGTDGAADPAAVRRRRSRADAGPRRLRAEALRRPSRRGAGRRARARDPELLVADRRLQGDADRAAARRLLPGPPRPARRVAARARPFPLLDQHVPQLGAGAPVPADRAQRRDQHAARQRELDAGARVAARVGALRGRPREGAPGDSSRGLRLGHVRQRARVARPRGSLAAALDDDDDPGGIRRPRRPPGRAEGLLRLPPVPAGGVGRAGRHRLHRRPRDRRDPRPERPAARPVARDPRRLGGARVGGRRPRRGPGQRRPEGTPPARGALPRRRRRRPDRPGRRGEARGRDPAAVCRVAPARDRAAGGSAGAPAVGAARRAAASPAARVRLLAGRHAGDPRAARAERRGARRLDGERPPARRPVGPCAAPLRVLQAAVRAGDEPAHRPDP